MSARGTLQGAHPPTPPFAAPPACDHLAERLEAIAADRAAIGSFRDGEAMRMEHRTRNRDDRQGTSMKRSHKKPRKRSQRGRPHSVSLGTIRRRKAKLGLPPGTMVFIGEQKMDIFDDRIDGQDPRSFC
ncbi:MAG: hypothetical protein D6795_07305 [Deltaproteobacteria bacterium]|nr:MAG: hypothetical protein D6795_07305 [Deltaproteobacteria bacterium]